jgi:polyisoprenoid-binding protein YceI
VLDGARTTVAFSGRAGRLAPTFRASFTSVSGTVDVGTPTQLAVDIDLASLSTGNRAWDDLLASLDPFDIARCPRAVFRGAADLTFGRAVAVAGALELRGVLRPVRLEARATQQADGEVRMTAHGDIDRRLFGVRCDLPGLSRFVPSVMRLDIDATAVCAA